MKLKNKKTGAVKEFSYVGAWNGRIVDDYDTLAELNEEWEDYVPEDAYFLQHDGLVDRFRRDDLEEEKEIGNYFETREEAELAVKKLKAWKRLKDKGIEFYGWRKNHTGTYDFLARWKGVPPKTQEIINDLDLLFGGEE